MVTLVIETGEIVDGANSLATEEELGEYAADRGKTLTSDPGILLIQAMDAMWANSYNGYLVDVDQGTPFPRTNLYIDGYLTSSTAVPILAKRLQMEYALAVDAGYNPLATQTQAIKSATSASGASVTYKDSSSSLPMLRAVNSILFRLGGSSGNGIHFHTRPSYPWGC